MPLAEPPQVDASRPDPGQRRRSRLVRRRRRLAIACAVVLVGAGAAIIASGGHDDGSASRLTTGAARGPAFRTKLIVRQANRLPAPISGEAVTPDGNRVLIAGGLDASSQSVSGVFSLDPASGRLQPAGQLAQPLHDAAAASLAGSTFVIGGGNVSSTATVERLGPGSPRIVGRMPTPRSDLVATTAAGRIWVIGGYDGRTLASDVLATSDGRKLTTAAHLPVPVRYPGVATLGNTIYLFGGETADGSATDAIQAIDASTGQARVVGHLDGPLAHASAVALGRRVYVLGGTAGNRPTDAILAFDPSRDRVYRAGRLPAPVSNAAAAVVGGTGYLVGGIGQNGAPVNSVFAITTRRIRQSPPPATSGGTRKQAAASSPAAPFRGRMLIADRGNNRLLVVNAAKRVLWRYPGRRPQPKGRFYFPDDAFFIHRGHAIISNEEENEAIVEIAYPSGRLLHSYGHPGVIGSSPGFFHEPDDAYLLRDGTVTVADAQNCRILFLHPNGRTTQIGTTGSCVHDPPRSLAGPNGDTPLANGDVLVSEAASSYVDELTPGGHLVWSTHLPIAYPSDPQRLGPDRYLVADYTRPGGIYEFNRAGRILWSYHPAGGPGMLDHPSLAERFPGGLIAANDDYRDRVVVIDPRTKRIVWQYGHTDHSGTAPGMLKTPDGMDLLAPSGRFPTHPYTG